MADDDWDTDPTWENHSTITKGTSKSNIAPVSNTRDLAQLVKQQAIQSDQQRIVQGDFRKGGRVSDMSGDRSKQQVFVAPSVPTRDPRIARETRAWGKDDASVIQSQIKSQSVATTPAPAPVASAPVPNKFSKPTTAPAPAPAPVPNKISKPTTAPAPTPSYTPPPPAPKPVYIPEPEPVQEDNWYDQEQDQGYSQTQIQVRAIYDYEASQEGDLPFYVGDIINVLDQSDPDGWWQGELNGYVGVFPMNFVEQI
eukprot:TRINITY_DN1546_c0_g3_i3.p1 TRINITY_DN1546_c0_g3~~TRINITY_DN1546_c0_g3_i3.p1  ORF type:complete len:254 (+),score=160.57 TRINITY_DN1546_c0_g3_i3:135-896(+)